MVDKETPKTIINYYVATWSLENDTKYFWCENLIYS